MNVLTSFASACLTLTAFYLRDKKRRMTSVLLALAIAVNYYSGFVVLFYELAGHETLRKRILRLVIEFMPVTLLISARTLMPAMSPYAWFPDASMWDDLFDLHCQNVFLWFWTVYILELCYALHLSLNSFGPVGRLLNAMFEKLEFLGFTFVVLAAMFALCISFI